MDALTTITTRASPLKLGEPGPTPDQVRTLLEAAIRAPDHCKLKPWRFLVIEGPARERLGDPWVVALGQPGPVAPEVMPEGEGEEPLVGSGTFVVIARVTRDPPKTPAI